MNQSEINDLFETTYNGNMNLMTPNLIRRGFRKGLAYEISKGNWMDSSPIYGVTVLTEHGKPRRDLNKCLNSLEEAETYIKNIKA